MGMGLWYGYDIVWGKGMGSIPPTTDFCCFFFDDRADYHDYYIK